MAASAFTYKRTSYTIVYDVRFKEFSGMDTEFLKVLFFAFNPSSHKSRILNYLLSCFYVNGYRISIRSPFW